MDEALAALIRAHGVEAVRDALGRHAAAGGAQNATLDLDALVAPESAPPDPGASRPPERIGGRYEDLGPIARGGMAEIRRAHDHLLDRIVAIKLLHAGRLGEEGWRARFVQEARHTAQLQHPAIVPVHDFGRLDDGRYWFAMAEVRGRTFGEVIAELHAGTGVRTLRSVVLAYAAVCSAVAHAHALELVHRDLKPDNIMVGHLGEVYVLDWGLADQIGGRTGPTAGTPAYMAPEELAGARRPTDPRADVYALGAVLYTLLSGASPYPGSPEEAVAAVRAGAPPALDRALVHDRLAVADAGASLPGPLLDVCARAMARDPAERYATAAALVADVHAWLDGSRLREQALALVRAAEAGEARAAELREAARRVRARGDALLAALPAGAGEDAKAPAWEVQDEADRLEGDAARAERETDERLEAALQIAPMLAEAHARRVDRLLAQHRHAEFARDAAAVLRLEGGLRTHAAALPATHPVHARAAAYLRGDGALTLVTDPPGAEVTLCRHVLHHRRLVPERVRDLGRTPLRAVPLPMGSYLCVIRHPERAEVVYPVHIEREAHWDGVPPEGGGPWPIRLPAPRELGPEDHYVPGGWFRCGGDPVAQNGLPSRRLWLDGWVVRRHPVRNEEYLAFLDDLVATGREADALRFAPRVSGSTMEEAGPLLVDYTGGRFGLRADAQGDLWLPDYPAVMISWWAAWAYAAWEATRTGEAWQPVPELVREKAARGVDGRWFPWGDRFEAGWSHTREGAVGRPKPAAVEGGPVDRSVYGVRGLAGNVSDWCADVYRPEGPAVRDGRPAPADDRDDPLSARVNRGGRWTGIEAFSRCCSRHWRAPSGLENATGTRLARPFR